jgi:hypothetical protein
MLTAAVGRFWHALVRDVLALGYRTADMFTTLSCSEMVSIVVAAPPDSSLRYFLDNGWSREAHLLANMAEQQSGVAKLDGPYERPGLGERSPGDNIFPADVMTWEEMDRLDALRESGQVKKGKTHVKVWS